MAFDPTPWLLLKTAIAAVGVATIARAAHRRWRRPPGAPPLDRALNLGLRVLAGCAALLLLALGIAWLGTVVPWGRQLLPLIFALLILAMAVALPLSLWLGWRAYGEETSLPPAHTGKDRDQVT